MGEELRSPAELINYKNSLAFVRQKIAHVGCGLTTCIHDFPHMLSEEGWTDTEQKCMASIQYLASRNLLIEQVDSEVGLLSLLNDLRATDGSTDLIESVTKVYQDLNSTLTCLKTLVDEFQNQVHKRLLDIFTSQMSVHVAASLQMAQDYQQEMSEKLSLIDRILADLLTLYTTYQNHINKDLLEESSRGCLSIVSLPRDVFLKISTLIECSVDCVNRDEKFVCKMSETMIEFRNRAKLVAQTLGERRQLHTDKLEMAKASSELLLKNKELLKQLDADLEEIESQMNTNETTRDTTIQEKAREESTIEFLNHTISTTKRNTGLQLKRQRLTRSKHELEQKLSEIENNLKSIQKIREEKITQKVEIQNSVESSQSSYAQIQEDLEKFTQSVAQVEEEAYELHIQLDDIETLHCVKTCPESLDNFADRPPSVKIARSLREKVATKKVSRRRADK